MFRLHIELRDNVKHRKELHLGNAVSLDGDGDPGVRWDSDLAVGWNSGASCISNAGSHTKDFESKGNWAGRWVVDGDLVHKPLGAFSGEEEVWRVTMMLPMASGYRYEWTGLFSIHGNDCVQRIMANENRAVIIEQIYMSVQVCSINVNGNNCK